MPDPSCSWTWTPEEAEHYRLEAHRLAVDKSELVEALRLIVKGLEASKPWWTEIEWEDAVEVALNRATVAMKKARAQ